MNRFQKLLRIYSRITTKKNHVTCCLECHFSYEEKEAFPYLPLEIQRELKTDHDLLLKFGKPEKEIFKHAEKEMEYFKKYCPDEVIERIQADHMKYAMEKNKTIILDGIEFNETEFKERFK